MKKFKVAVQWMMTAELVIEAENLSNAKLLAEHSSSYNPEELADCAVYLNDSWEVNEQLTNDLNKENG